MAWIAWNKIQCSKSEGGLGMRDLHVFNKALLAKQAWRVLTNTSSLMARVLKGKYFPNSDFMNAKILSGISYTWRSILSVRELISKGALKTMGKGNNVDIWKESWVPKLPNFRVFTRQNPITDGCN
ncbi:uncharacterized protein LOC110704668 [Chenopodium quinoa]|uniref:uncharacterized protein LOC110704668 n=1 Tax=Chenopodium quinoa TaxID=63459 RepID=UPI000B78E272|nr:uncharacterized protein LOC110704668 [Chenopodium quinoa]